MTSIHKLREQSNMKISELKRKSPESFSHEQAMALFGEEKHTPDCGRKSHLFPRRGVFSCTHESSTGIVCCFSIPFAWKKDSGKYEIHSGKVALCAEHNHQSNGIVLDGCEHVDSELNLENRN